MDAVFTTGKDRRHVDPQPGNAQGPAAGRRLLLVEDEFLIRLTLAETLADAGYEVVEAEDADEALARLGESPVDLLLTDIQLPGPVNGNELAKRVRAVLPELPVIFMTGRPEPGAGHLAGKREVTISKPYLPSEVCAAIARLLGA